MIMRLLPFVSILLIFACSLPAQHARRDKLMQPERIMDTLGVRSGMVIGEVGAGEGYFTLKLAKRVGSTGRIYANDINTRVLETVKERREEALLDNIETVVGEVADPLFPVRNLDMVVMMMVYHDLTRPDALMKSLKKYLKPGAPVVIIDRDPDRWGKGHDHFLKKDTILENMAGIGFELVRLHTFLEIDNIFVYRPR
jgi:ubiquinone/menaquinone biosynthesis C-methylase UbiE